LAVEINKTTLQYKIVTLVLPLRIVQIHVSFPAD